ncbi:JNK-interacting protein 1 [Strongyloides ratti]|uniref:JNK-interacting protein 1 n=1 Tax=Strongyloides ratti TaxID=34506 RepID=A0A090KS08_STRRB|nr:JNK-interacting protein 1 [Strongyloides ratti]CEF60280.1 JNK-interacting protein 1 [Strongyloides ratti]
MKSQQTYTTTKSETSRYSDKELLEYEIDNISNDMNPLPNAVLSDFLKKYNQERIHHLKKKNDDEMETSSDSDEDLYMHKVLAPLRKSKTTPGLYNSSQIREYNTKEKKSSLLPLLKSQTAFNFMEIQRSKIIKNDKTNNECSDSKDKICLIENCVINNYEENTRPILKNYCCDNIYKSNCEISFSKNINDKIEILQEDKYIERKEEVCEGEKSDKIIENKKYIKDFNKVDEIKDNKNIYMNRCCLESNSTINNLNLYKVWSVPSNIDYFGEGYDYQNTPTLTSYGWSAPELDDKYIYHTTNTSIYSSMSSKYKKENNIRRQSIIKNALNIIGNSLYSYKDFDDDEDDDLQLTKFGDTKYFENMERNISFIKNKISKSMSDSNLLNLYEDNFDTTIIEKNTKPDMTYEKLNENNLITKDKLNKCHLPISISMIENFELKKNIIDRIEENMSSNHDNYKKFKYFSEDNNSIENLNISSEKNTRINNKNIYEENNKIKNEMLWLRETQVNNENEVKANNNYDNFKNDNFIESYKNVPSNRMQTKENYYDSINEESEYYDITNDELQNHLMASCDTENKSHIVEESVSSSYHNQSPSTNSSSTLSKNENVFVNYNSQNSNSLNNFITSKNQNCDKYIVPNSLSFYSKSNISSNCIVNGSSLTPINSISSISSGRKRILPKRPDFIECIPTTPNRSDNHAATASCAMSNYRIEDDLVYKRNRNMLDFVQYNSGPNVNHQDGGNNYYSTQINNNRFSNSMSQQYLSSNMVQNIPGLSQVLQTNNNTGSNRSHRKLPPLPIKAEIAALIEGIAKPLPPSISSLMNPSNHIPQQGHSSINSTNKPVSLDYDVHIEPQMQHSPCYPYIKANTLNGRNSGDHQLCYGIESTIIRSTCTIEDSYYEDGLNGNAQGSVKQVIHTNNDDSSGVSSCCTNIDNLNPTHRVQNIFIPRHDDEILLEIGDAIHVEREYDDHWCFGTNLRTGKHGIFPSAHICEIDLVEEICMGALNCNPAKQLQEDRDTFYLTMLASIEVAHHKGNDVLVQAINKVMSCYQNKEEILVPQTVLMEVSLRGIHVIDKKKKNFFRCPTFDFFFSLQNISFCGAHPKHLKYFGFITKHPLLPRFACHVFLSNQSTQPIVEAIGRAFKRSYDEYMAFAHPTEDIYIE